MKIIEKNEGPKIPYSVEDKKICFDDDLTINLQKRQKDGTTEHIDVCYDNDRELVIGAAAGRAYVAELDIPPIEYDESGEERTPLPLDMDKVTLSLWAIE